MLSFFFFFTVKPYHKTYCVIEMLFNKKSNHFDNIVNM